MGKAGFNLELFPPAYFGKTFHLGDRFGVFPRQHNGPMVLNPAGATEDMALFSEYRELTPAPLATGSRLCIAPEDPLRRMIIERIRGGGIQLLDGRNTAQNGWFVVRSLVPPNATADAVEWAITPHSIPGWRRKPVIGISQVWYHPDQAKRAIIELDPRTEQLGEATLLRVDPEQGVREVLSGSPKRWGRFLRYDYAVFNFTDVKEPGIYMIKYESESTPPFRISRDILKSGVWQPTLETYFPVQMCHMKVRDVYRVWHNACHLDDALQAPPSHVHFDGYRQGPETETPYSAHEHIPHLNAGGWHDAGDDDLAAGSQAQTTYVLALAREAFGVDSDQTTVRRGERLVLLHTPDGVPDIVQQIAHGVENLLSGYRAAGHSFSGIISSSLDQYVTVGDPSSMTDNRCYDPSVRPNEVRGEESGKMDDRWAFTSRDTSQEYKVITALAAASRALRGYEDALAEECLNTAVIVWDYEQTHPPVEHRSAYVPGQPLVHEVLATVELLITTGDDRHRQRLIDSLPTIVTNIDRVGWAVVRALPFVEDIAFASSVRDALKEYQTTLKVELAKNPFHVPHRLRIWGITWNILAFAVEQYYLVKAYPELFDRENIFSVLHYVLGCHPSSNVSLVCGIGTHSKTASYVFSRADWSYIPGSITSGPNLIQPDFPELKVDFPFLWQQSEHVIHSGASYVFCILACDELLSAKCS